jgi:hypothetical protein
MMEVNAPVVFVTSEDMTVAGTMRISSPPGAQFRGEMSSDPFSPESRYEVQVDCSFTGRLVIAPWEAAHKTGPGLLSLTGVHPFTYIENLHVGEGSVYIAQTDNECVWGLTVGNPATPTVPASVTLGTSNLLYDGGIVELANANATLHTGTTTQSAWKLIMTGGTVSGSASSRLGLRYLITHPAATPAVFGVELGGTYTEMDTADGPAVPDLLINAACTQSAGMGKTGPGRADFMAAIPQGGLGVLWLEQGSALFFHNCRYTNIELHGGLLGGNGTVGNIESVTGGTISPGSSPGALGGYKGIWNADVTLRMELNGLTPGSEFDQYVSYLPPDLGGAALQLSTGFDPAPGDSFMIVRNISGEPITGQFANAPEGGHVSAPGGKVFQITYTGGDGDDVVLTRVIVNDPEIIEWAILPAPSPTENPTAHFIFKGVPGLTYTLQYSTDLQSWHALKSDRLILP